LKKYKTVKHVVISSTVLHITCGPCNKIHSATGLRLDPLGAYTAPQTPLLDLRGLLLKEKKGLKKEHESKVGEGKRRKGRGGKRGVLSVF